MSNVDFNEEPIFNKSVQFHKKESLFVQKMIDWELAKDDKSANIILLFIALIFFAASIYVFVVFFVGGSSQVNNQEILDPENLPPIQ